MIFYLLIPQIFITLNVIFSGYSYLNRCSVYLLNNIFVYRPEYSGNFIRKIYAIFFFYKNSRILGLINQKSILFFRNCFVYVRIKNWSDMFISRVGDKPVLKGTIQTILMAVSPRKNSGSNPA